jgi:hypothetical protein
MFAVPANRDYFYHGEHEGGRVICAAKFCSVRRQGTRCACPSPLWGGRPMAVSALKQVFAAEPAVNLHDGLDLYKRGPFPMRVNRKDPSSPNGLHRD